MSQYFLTTRCLFIFLALCVAQAVDLSAPAKNQRKSIFGGSLYSSGAPTATTSVSPSLRRLRRHKLEKISTYVQSAEYSDLVIKGGNGIIQSYKAAFAGSWDTGLAAIGCAAMTMTFAWISAQPSTVDAVTRAKVALFAYAVLKLLDAAYLVSHELGVSEDGRASAASVIAEHSPQFAYSDDGQMTVFALLCSLGLRGKNANFLRIFTSLGLREVTLIAQSFWVLLLVIMRPLIPADTCASIHDLLFNASSSTFACEATEVNMSLTSAPSELVAIISLALDAAKSLAGSFGPQKLLVTSVIVYVGCHYIVARGKRLYAEPVVRSLLDPILQYSKPLMESVTAAASDVKNKLFSGDTIGKDTNVEAASTRKSRLPKKMRKKSGNSSNKTKI